MQTKYEPGMPGYKTAVVTGTIVRGALNLILIGLLLWAASETTGYLHWALLGYVGYSVVVQMLVATAVAAKRDVTR